MTIIDVGLKSLGPAVQYLAGELLVQGGSIIPLQASHNTVAMRFDVEEADYLHISKTDAAFPLHHLYTLRDEGRSRVSCCQYSYLISCSDAFILFAKLPMDALPILQVWPTTVIDDRNNLQRYKAVFNMAGLLTGVFHVTAFPTPKACSLAKDSLSSQI